MVPELSRFPFCSWVRSCATSAFRFSMVLSLLLQRLLVSSFLTAVSFDHNHAFSLVGKHKSVSMNRRLGRREGRQGFPIQLQLVLWYQPTLRGYGRQGFPIQLQLARPSPSHPPTSYPVSACLMASTYLTRLPVEGGCVGEKEQTTVAPSPTFAGLLV